MAISVSCAGCDAVYSVGENLLGKTIKCKACGEMMKVVAPKAKASRPVPDDADDAPRRSSRRRDEDDDEYDDAPRAKKKGPPVALLAGLGAVLLVGGAVAGFALMSGDDPKPDNTPVAAANVTPAVTPAPDADGTKPKAEPKKADKPAAKADETPADDEKVKAKADDKPAAKADDKPAPLRAAEPRADRDAPPASSSGLSRREYLNCEMTRFTMEKVKKASVMFRVETQEGGGEGSGWFGLEPGIIFTNAHVIAMKSPNAKPPKKITLYLNAGTPEQRTIENVRVKILAVDWDLDLAVLKVENEKDLPTPLEVGASADLQDGQKLKTIGYPFGSRSGLTGKPPPVAVRPTEYTRSLQDTLGRTRRIQIEGGVYTGNSGGPIVDGDGVVRGVVVEVQIDQLSGGQSQLGLGVPTEYVLGLAAGRVASVEYGVPYKDGGSVKIPVKAKCLDPFGRLKSVGLASWVGDVPVVRKDEASPFRRESVNPPKMGPADESYKELPLKYDPATKLATGEITMPLAAAGKAYWAQPFYSNPINAKYFMPGTPVSTDGPPVDRVPVNLTVRIKEGAVRSVEMTASSTGLNILDDDESDQNQLSLKTTMKVRETTVAPDRNDTNMVARLKMQIENFKLSAEVAGQGIEIERVMPKRIEEQFNELFKQVEAIGALNRFGELYKYVLNVLSIPDPQAKAIVQDLGSQAVQALVATSIPLPNKQMQPGESWGGGREERLTLVRITRRAGPRGQTEQKGRPVDYRYRGEIKYTYVGTRERAGKKEAVVQIEGKLVPAAGEKAKVDGEVKGLALIELDTGLVTKAEVKSYMSMEMNYEGKSRRVTASNSYTVNRTAAN